VNQPGLGALRDAVTNAARNLPSRRTSRRDGLAGLTVAVSSVPDGMASGLLAGVNPIYGLYAGVVGPIAGGLLSSAALMVITTTSAASLVAGKALVGLPREGRESAFFLMVILAGAFQILFGLLRLGRLTGFVSYSVMTGFLAGIAVVLLLSQLPTVVGYEVTGAHSIAQTIDLLKNLHQVNLASVGLSGLTLILAGLLVRTRLSKVASLLAIAVPTLLVALFGMESVQTVRDVGEIPGRLPTPSLPSFSALSFDVLTGALAVATIVLVQGAGVSQSVPNSDGSRHRASRDFIAQGVANVVSGLFRGLPVGGSVGATALNVEAGARRRWGAIFTGLWMAAIVVGFSGVVSRVAMPALAGLLIFAAIRSIKPSAMPAVWHAGWPSRIAATTTFLATLVLPIQAAVGLGVAISALLYVFSSSTDVSVVELVRRSDGRVEERTPPKRVPGGRVTVLDVYGHLFFAGARTLERLLPRPGEGRHPVVVLRLRGRRIFEATLVQVLSDYAKQLEAVDGRLYLTGLNERTHDEVERSGKFRLHGPVRAYEVTPILGQSTREAYDDAQAWLVGLREHPP
jgi:sulfate permease, SulP family